MDSKIPSLHHSWVVPSLAAPLRSPEGFLDGRGLTSCLFCFLILWVSRGRVRSQEQTQGSHSIFLLPGSCFLLPAPVSLDPEGQILYLLPRLLGPPLTSYPVVFKGLLLLSGLCSCLSRTFSSVMLVACFCLSVLPVACVTVASPPRPS